MRGGIAAVHLRRGPREIGGRRAQLAHRGLEIEQALLAFHRALVDATFLRDHLIDELGGRGEIEVARRKAERVRDEAAQLTLGAFQGSTVKAFHELAPTATGQSLTLDVYLFY